MMGEYLRSPGQDDAVHCRSDHSIPLSVNLGNSSGTFFSLSAGGGSLYIIFVLTFELLLPLLYNGVSQRKSNIYTLDWSNIGNALLLGEPFIPTCH